MAFLKNTLITILLSFSISIAAQETIVNAFAVSYTKEKDGNYSAAIESLKKVYNEESYEINIRLGWLHYLSGMFTESISYYNNALNNRPYSIEARLGLALPASSVANWSQVILLYEQILEIDPQNTLVNYRMGVIYYEKKQYNKAEAFLKKVINLYPFDHDSLLMLAWVKYQQGNLQEAKVLFYKTLMYNPKDASAKEGLALIK